MFRGNPPEGSEGNAGAPRMSPPPEILSFRRASEARQEESASSREQPTHCHPEPRVFCGAQDLCTFWGRVEGGNPLITVIAPAPLLPRSLRQDPALSGVEGVGISTFYRPTHEPSTRTCHSDARAQRDRRNLLPVGSNQRTVILSPAPFAGRRTYALFGVAWNGGNPAIAAARQRSRSLGGLASKQATPRCRTHSRA